MKSIEIKASLRKEIGKKQTKALRNEGKVPCVMYGGDENVHFTAFENDFRNIIYTHDVYEVKFDIEGKKYQAILKDAQFHPVTDKILHLDFIQVNDDKPAVVDIPIVVKGNSEGIRAGGKLRQRRRYLKVKGLLKNLPEHLEIDITDLNIGDFIKIMDLRFDNIELMDPQKAMVVGVSASRLSKGMELDEDLVGKEGEAAEEGAEAEGGSKEASKADSE